jgi:hypothetical protein
MTRNKARLHRFRKDRKALSPAISSVIMTCAVVVLLLVTIVFANNFLDARMAENEFDALKQFMQTVGLQTDDVAWTIGRTQTIRYASKFGVVDFESPALNYSVYVNDTIVLGNYSTGILLFNMPINEYSMGNNYEERIIPSSDRSFLQVGTSAPICHVFITEKVPMNDGNYIRVVVAPSIRMLNSTITNGGVVTNYFKFYLPILKAGVSPRHSQSVSLAGRSVSVDTNSSVTKVKIHVDFLKASLGFNSQFFNFDNVNEEIDVPDGSIVQFYTGEVTVSLGLYA